jgi:hypothetical protein
MPPHKLTLVPSAGHPAALMPAPLPTPLPNLPRAAGDNAFWPPAVGTGVQVIVTQVGELDTLAERIASLPARSGGERIVVGQYLAMLRMLAAGWPTRSRHAVLQVLSALGTFSERLTVCDGPLLTMALGHVIDGGGHGAADCARLLGALQARLDAPIRALEAVNSDCGSYLAQMAAASCELETDTMLVTQRLQADHVHASLLARRIDSAQAQLDRIRMSKGGEAGCEKQRAMLDGGRGQLDAVRAAQAALLNEAASLHVLLPALSAYLAGVDRLGSGIHAALFGAHALQSALGELRHGLQDEPRRAGAARSQLERALPEWHRLALRLAARPAPGGRHG